MDYINYDKIKNSTEGDILVKCYYNGNRWICPNPNNRKLCEYIHSWYESTHNVTYKEIKITKELLEIALIKNN